jgi:hypothetical protein
MPSKRESLTGPKSKSDVGQQTFKDMMQYLHENILAMNQSKLFAGLVIIVLNISSKFVTIRLSKTVEGYLKYTFSRDVLVFAMAWMGTRDIYTALFITIVFSLFANFIFNEDSRFCILPESFIDLHASKVDSPPAQFAITEQQITEAITLLSNAKQQKEASAQGKTQPTSIDSTTTQKSANDLYKY